MSGPNRGRDSAFFSQWPVLEEELNYYLEERAAGPPSTSAGAEKSLGNTLLKILSIDPTSITRDNDAAEIEEWEGEADILAYSELSRYGYGYLVEPIMNFGGYAEASKRMGIPLNDRVLKDREYYTRRNPPTPLKKPETDGFLTLGRARDERLDSVAEVDREMRRRELFEKQAMMDKDADVAAIKAQSKALASAQATNTNGFEEQPVESFRPPGLPDARKVWVPSGEADRQSPEPFLLSLSQRTYIIVFVACSAVAFGRGTPEALQLGILTHDLADTATFATLLLSGINIASAAASAVLARRKGRSVPFWLFKGLLSGLTGVLELKAASDMSLTTGSAENGDAL